ncbi:MAG TPA: SRPBCC domain-containing protein [Burkholderiales bacterium]|nr:SRPBCC domain-containing protein [Burkholderiales bacterium]
MNERTVTITRVFDAPRERVFAAWTRAEHLAHWFGPKGFAIHSCETDPRRGGLFRLCLRAPDGRDYWVRGTFRELVPPERIVILCTADDDKGVPRLEEVIDVTLAERGGKTELKLLATASGAGHEAAAMLDGMPKGWAQTINRLDGHLNPDS